MILAVTSIAGSRSRERKRGEGASSVMLLTLLSLAVFAGTGHVDWPAGLALGRG